MVCGCEVVYFGRKGVDRSSVDEDLRHMEMHIRLKVADRRRGREQRPENNLEETEVGPVWSGCAGWR